MKKFIMISISMVILLSAPLAMARGNTVRATLNRIWQKQQARQEKIDKDLSSMSKDMRNVAPGYPSTQGWTTYPQQMKNR
jgi:hypothetical protein